jgi:hypothetical protein
LIITVFLFESGGYYLRFSLTQVRHKMEILGEIRSGEAVGELTEIVVPADGETGIRWIERGREFRYHGEMYDVVRHVNRGDNIWYYCYRDSRERQRVAGFRKGSRSKSQADRKTIPVFVYQFAGQSNMFVSWITPTDFLFPVPVNRYQSTTAETHSPPPRET